MSVLFTAGDVAGLISLPEAVEAVAAAYEEWAYDPQLCGLRQRVHAPSGARITVHPGASPQAGNTGLAVHCEVLQMMDEVRQQYVAFGTPVRVLYDVESGELVAVIVGEIASRELPNTHVMFGVSTAAVSTLGTKLLAKPESETVAVLGSGSQARLHLAAICAERAVRRARVYSPTVDNRERFARECSEAFEIPVEAVAEAEVAVQGADIVLCMSNSNVPILDGSWLSPGAHVTSLVVGNTGLVARGSLRQMRREIDDGTLRRASVVAACSVAQIEQDRGADLYETLRDGVLTKEKVIDLGTLLRGEHPGRRSAGDITVFKNTALYGSADQAISRVLVERAMELGRGVKLDVPAAHFPQS